VHLKGRIEVGRGRETSVATGPDRGVRVAPTVEGSKVLLPQRALACA
jgi:hypothetical protein